LAARNLLGAILLGALALRLSYLIPLALDPRFDWPDPDHYLMGAKLLTRDGWDWTFRRPVFAGDTIRAILTVEDKRATRNPERGILILAVEGFNQSGEVVQRGTNRLMAYR
jgi:acyl dehydratase